MEKINHINKTGNKRKEVVVNRRDPIELTIRTKYIRKMKERQKEQVVKIKDFKKHFSQ